MSAFKAGDKVRGTDPEAGYMDGLLQYRVDNGMWRVVSQKNPERTKLFFEHELMHLETPDPYADYPNGATQYAADVATLTEAGMLADKATAGEWVYQPDYETGAVIHNDVEDILFITASGVASFNSDADAQIIINAARVARALSRFVPWALARLGGDK